MNLAVLTFHLGGAGWVIQSTDGKLRIDAKEACVDGKCRPTGEVTVDGRGMWFLASLDLDMRWASPDSVELRTATSGWVPADLQVDARPAKLPADAVVEAVTRWDRGVLPGVWSRGTVGCEAGAEAWHYRPLLDEVPASMVVGAKVTAGAKVEPCPGAGGLGIHPTGPVE